MYKQLIFLSVAVALMPMAVADTVHDFNLNQDQGIQGVSAEAVEPVIRKEEQGGQPLPLQEADTSNHAEQVLAAKIDRAIRQNQWQNVEALLKQYEALSGHDPYLVLYAKSGLCRAKQQYACAIDALSALLAQKPELDYPRLDLALMLAEDRQYREALVQLDYLRNKKTDVAAVAEKYAEQIRKRFETQWDFSANYTHNDNVNQAGSAKTLKLWGVTFVKDPDNLPKSGNGITYQVGVSKLIPIAGHHYFNPSASYGGTHYWDQQDYSESTLHISPGYVYQNRNWSIQAAPFFDQNWLGGARYGQNSGIGVYVMKPIGKKHAVAPYAIYAKKRYQENRLSGYEGNRYQGGVTWLYWPNTRWRLSSGIDYISENLKEDLNSSHTLAMRLGAAHQWQNGLGAQISLRLAERRFEKPFKLFGVTRNDKEYSGNVSVWHNRVAYKGFMPKLVYQYRKTKSNIPALYSWDSKGLHLEIGKQF